MGGGGDHDIDAAIACWRRTDKMSDIVRDGQCSDILKNSNLLIKGVVGIVQEWLRRYSEEQKVGSWILDVPGIPITIRLSIWLTYFILAFCI